MNGRRQIFRQQYLGKECRGCLPDRHNMALEELMVIAGYPGMEANVREVSQAIGIDPVIVQWELAEPAFVSMLQKYFAANGRPDVIVARGALSNMIEVHFKNIVLVRAEPSELDLLCAVRACQQWGSRIGVLLQEREGPQLNVSCIQSMLQLEQLKVYPFHTKEDIIHQVIQCKADGLHAIAGGGTLAGRVGKGIDFPTCMAQTGKMSLHRALFQATAILKVLRREKQFLRYFQMASEAVDEGIAVIDHQKITFVNDTITRIFHSDRASLVGMPVTALSDAFFKGGRTLAELLRCGDGEQVLTICDKKYLIKRQALSTKDENQALLIFFNADTVYWQEQKLRKDLHTRRQQAKYRFEDIQGSSPAIQAVLSRARAYARTPANILITGESGTGKELFAQSIHNASARCGGPFVAINCAAIPDALLESELFGYEEGAFSGAQKGGKPGLFEIAHHGTVFLDEIDSLPIRLQGVLLRVLQEKEVRRIGSRRSFAIDIRVIAAANRDIHRLIETGGFRADLYYRLNIFQLAIPSLSSRRADIIPLARHFLNTYAALYKTAVPTLQTQDEAILERCTWMGNVRELENTIQRFVMLCCIGPTTIADCLDPGEIPTLSCPEDLSCYHIPKGTLRDMARALILQTLAEHKNNKSAAAAALGIGRTTIWKALKDEAPSMDGDQ